MTSQTPLPKFDSPSQKEIEAAIQRALYPNPFKDRKHGPMFGLMYLGWIVFFLTFVIYGAISVVNWIF